MIGTKRLLLLSVAFGLGVCSAHAASRLAERGKYLTDIIPCTDCHTPGSFLGHPDMNRYLGGSEVGFAIPGLGVFYGSNLTSDKDTGLGNWTVPQIVKAITEGVAPDGRKLAPPMPSEWFHHLSHSDAEAIATYLKTLPPVKNKVPGPFGPTQRPVGFVMQVVPAARYMPPPPPRPLRMITPGAGAPGAVPPPTPTPSTVPAPVPTPSKTAPPMPMPSPGGGAPVPKPSNVPAPMPPTPTQNQSPAPAPSPTPAPSPGPAPAPAPSPTPAPSPSPAPVPSPSPTPAPSPAPAPSNNQ